MRVSSQVTLLILILIALSIGACSQTTPSRVENSSILLRGRGRGVALVEAQLPPHEYSWMQKLFGKKQPPLAWWNRHLQVTADAPVPEGATSHVEATMMARAKARDKALEAMLEKAAELPNQIGNKTIAEEISNDMEIRKSTADTIRRHVKIVRGSTLEDEKAYRIVMQLPLWHLAQDLYDIPSESWTNKKLQPDSPADNEAFRLAHLDAESHLRQLIENYSIGARTIGQLVNDNPVLWHQLHECLSNAEITETVFPEPGACEVSLRVDITELYKTARAESGRLR